MIGSLWDELTDLDVLEETARGVYSDVASQVATIRGPKTVAPDAYFGPDVNPSTGTYVPFAYEGPDINRETGLYSPPASSRSSATAPPAAGFPWVAVAGGVVVLSTLAWLLLRRRRA